MTAKFIRLPDVRKCTGLSRSLIYKKIADGDFPRQIRLGGEKSRVVVWLESDIQQWMENQIAQQVT